MASKMIVALFAILVCASAGYVESDHYHAPMTHYSFAPDVSYSSITQHSSPKLTVAKTIAYAEPSMHYSAPLTKTIVQQPTIISEPIYSHAAPIVAEKTLAYSTPAEYTKTLSYAPLTKTVVSQPAYIETIAAEPTSAKAIYSEPTYTKTVIQQQQQPTFIKTILSEPAYAHGIPDVAAKTLSYTPTAPVSYGEASAHHSW
ncbi:uncharacterized protein LOC129771399 [Toxorhynchites rutilus septentrionalis]|uniref:uncharacterized protein LOC129771399 n=1 Tax=Toxorhynchites rutilus septentrionalis TaxID=329112 RepID=UPI0024787D03|nr:uncharacterized protein LOC129771399 [Toxorhynchites rutilus septentrionalis]